MSAADAANPMPGQTPLSTLGVVIPMFKRDTPSQPAAGPAGEQATAAQDLAEQIEALFHRHGMTLTDDETARVYDVTLDLVRMMHDGAHADGGLTGEQLAQLAAMVQGMRGAPQLL
jgi:hypothetical protein